MREKIRRALINTLLQQGGSVPESGPNRFQRFLAPLAICHRPFAIVCQLFLTFIAVIGLIAGCSKNSSSQSAAPQSFNLGSVELTYGMANRQDLGTSATCVLTAQPLDRQSFELLADLEKSGKKIASTRVMPAKIGVPLQLSFGTVLVQLTPQIRP